MSSFAPTPGKRVLYLTKDPKRIRAAVNQEHANFEAPLKRGDEVAFFPPVTGA